MSLEVTPRLVKVYSTVGQNKQEIRSSAGTWDGLRSELNRHDVKHTDMKAVIGETNVSLEIGDAILPTTDFTLFLVPEKVKSGIRLGSSESDTTPLSSGNNYSESKSTPAYDQREALRDIDLLLEEASLEYDELDAVERLKTYIQNRPSEPMDPEIAALDKKAREIQERFRN